MNTGETFAVFNVNLLTFGDILLEALLKSQDLLKIVSFGLFLQGF